MKDETFVSLSYVIMVVLVVLLLIVAMGDLIGAIIAMILLGLSGILLPFVMRRGGSR